MNSYQCQQYSRDRGVPKIHSAQNYMISLTLDSGRVAELQNIIDATLFECMFMRFEKHQSCMNLYKFHAVNFLQDFNSFLALARSKKNLELSLIF